MKEGDRVYYVWGSGLMQGVKICKATVSLHPGGQIVIGDDEFVVTLDENGVNRIGSFDQDKVAESESTRAYPLCQFYRTEKEAMTEYKRKLEEGILVTVQHLFDMKVALDKLNADSI